ncbi:MAG: hypothetical protein JSU95_09755 [Betaproteobacteria bacterium]|nr:MAG: hypothetical protein JSU95_09755 [Betaproteobacteria bacterium]
MTDAVAVSSDATTALNDLVAHLQSAADTEDPKERIDATGKVQEAGVPHFSALLAQYLDDSSASYTAHEALWKSLANYQTRLTQVLCTVAAGALTADSATHALRAVRALVKLHLFHYADVPEKLWHITSTIHASAEKNGFSTTPVQAYSGDHTMTSVEQELLRVLMLHVSMPDMLDAEQIEVVDRAVERLGAEFTLRQPGVTDNPFCYEPGSSNAPKRAVGDDLPGNARYFGPGLGYDSLERLAKQAAAGKPDDFKPFGKDLSSLAQSNAVQHLLAFWRTDCPYAPPEHSAASGSILVAHGYAHVWQHVSEASGTGELSLLADSVMMPQAPEVWELRGEGGDELVAEVPPASRGWAKCGAVVGLTINETERWVGLIRRMHAESDGSMRAYIAVLSDQPQTHSLREVLDKHADNAFTEAASRQFGLSEVNTLILADESDSGQPPNLMIKPDHWKAGRVYELQEDNTSRYLRGLKAIRRGDDFVRATFEWISTPD